MSDLPDLTPFLGCTLELDCGPSGWVVAQRIENNCLVVEAEPDYPIQDGETHIPLRAIRHFRVVYDSHRTQLNRERHYERQDQAAEERRLAALVPKPPPRPWWSRWWRR